MSHKTQCTNKGTEAGRSSEVNRKRQEMEDEQEQVQGTNRRAGSRNGQTSRMIWCRTRKSGSGI